MKKINRTLFKDLFINKDFTNSSILLYLFLTRSASEYKGTLIIEDFTRNSIIEDMKSIMPFVSKSTMYRAFDSLFEMGKITHPYNNATGKLDMNTIYLPNSTDGFLPGSEGFLYVYDMFFNKKFFELKLGTKRALLYILHRIGTSKKSVKISLDNLINALIDCSDLTTKYKILRAINELKKEKIIAVSRLKNNVFAFKLNAFSDSKPTTDYIIDYKKRHYKKAQLIKSISKKANYSFNAKEFTYIIKALFRRTLSEIKIIMATYIETLENNNKPKNVYRYIRAIEV